MDSIPPARQSLVFEINEVRLDPIGYADRLASLKRDFNGFKRRLSDGKMLTTQEGWAPVEEAIRILRNTPRLPRLATENRLAASALAHVNDIGPKGLMTHNGSSGESFIKRVARFLSNARLVGETMHFGPMTDEEVVMAWLIDDGVSDRGHRKILLSPAYNAVGTACGPHSRYKEMCVADFANR